jgi:aminoglycoside phosphotransferase (APT) family kinase protein
MEGPELVKKLGVYLSTKYPARKNLVLENPNRIFGGASRETWILDVAFDEAGTQKIVVRITQDSALIETDEAIEYHAYSAFYGTSVPVPEPLFLEQDKSHIGFRFVVIAAVTGKAASIMEQDPYLEHREKVGLQKWKILGDIAAMDPAAVGLTDKLPAPKATGDALKQLEYWEKVINDDAPEPQPIAQAAIRWMKKNLPPEPARTCVVHGDYRTGNYMVDDAGDITAILDWEMCHLGDPLEDLGWALSPLWCFGDEAKSGGTIPRADAIALWKKTSGFDIAPHALDWWEKFACVKGLAIWLSAADEFISGKNTDSVNLFPAWRCVDVHNRILISLFRDQQKTGQTS